MKNNRIEQSLSRALEDAPAIPFEELAAAPFIKMAEHDYITRQETVSTPRIGWRYAFATVLCLLLLMPATGWFYMNRLPDSTILLDVNPSISIVTNHYNKVISVVGLNEDAKALLQNPDYDGSELEATVLELLDDLVKESYLSAEKNTILVTVIQKNSRKAEELRSRIDLAIREGLISKNITPVVLSQKISKEAKRSDLARQYHISEGKMKLIQEILAVNDSYSEAELAGMSMEALLALAKKNSMDLNSYNLREDNAATSQESENRSEDTEQEDQNDLEDQEDKNSSKTEENVNSEDQEDQDEEDQDEKDQVEEDQDEEGQVEEDQDADGQDEEGQDEEDQDEEDQDGVGQDEEGQDEGNSDVNEQDNADQSGDESEDQDTDEQVEGERTGTENQDNKDQQDLSEQDLDSQDTLENSDQEDAIENEASDLSEDSGEGDQGDNEASSEEDEDTDNESSDSGD